MCATQHLKAQTPSKRASFGAVRGRVGARIDLIVEDSTMTASARPTPDDFSGATWPAILPRFDALAEAPLDLENVETWLREWSDLNVAIGEAIERASVAYTVNTNDKVSEEAYNRLTGDVAPQMQEQTVRLSARLLELDYEPDDLKVMLKTLRNQQEIFRPENVAINQQLQRLDAKYEKITGGMTALWEGERIPLARLKPFFLVPDRATRKRAFRKGLAPYVRNRNKLAQIFDQQYALRQQMAANAGFENYRDFVFREKNRFDYTPADCLAFHDAVAETIVPVVTRLNDAKRSQLGVRTLRPWDTAADPFKRPGLAPYEATDELIAASTRMLGKVNPVFGDYLETMNREGLLDLESREGKAPGGYCTFYEYSGRPFIFMNASKTQDDVETLLHEGGHAIHTFEVMQNVPISFARYPGEEMAEVGSMAMELLAAPYLEKEQGGFYSPDDARRARREHLEGILSFFTWCATIDAFQHWIYTSGTGGDANARDAAWLEISGRFNAGVDWSGYERDSIARWYRQLHIWLVPFYYIEYGIAQLGALQVWRNSKTDQAAATEAYRKALALGNTRPLPELFATAGARFAFDAETIGELAQLIEDELATLAD
jgi:oligoendopeptidase F